MKKLLFSFALSIGAFVSTITAQTRTWDFNDAAVWTTAGLSYTTDYNGLMFIAGSSAFTGFSAQNAGPFGDGYSATQRLAFGGNSYSGSTNPAVGTVGTMPTRRYLEVSVTGNSTIKYWARGGGANRSIVVTNKTNQTVIGNTTFTAATDIQIGTVTYTGGVGTIIIAAGAGDNSLFKIEVTNTDTMAVNDVKSGVKANVYSSGNKIYVANLESKKTDINVYNANGSLVKSLKSSSDTNFDINGKGLYIVNLKSEAGEKSVKVLLK
ncbi:T9SS type A sorting domain-containing protein [Epilithonimonas sp. UC225_85]|uniref:T9SS type A sorting domain-containing protein n=1 Tax=Epilithonimonas sp. UC225_85 TaxID=3350167 RepID=UPI0036D3E926